MKNQKNNGTEKLGSVTPTTGLCNSGADQRKHQSSEALAFVRGIHRWPVNSPHKRPVMRKMFPFDDAIMIHAVRVLCFFFVVTDSYRQCLILFCRHYDYLTIVWGLWSHPDLCEWRYHTNPRRAIDITTIQQSKAKPGTYRVGHNCYCTKTRYFRRSRLECCSIMIEQSWLFFHYSDCDVIMTS